MFETETEQMAEQRRSRIYLVLGGVGALVLAIVIVMLSRSTRSTPPLASGTPTPGGIQAKLEGALRAGNPDYDGYRPQITIEETEIYAAPNALGMTRFTVTSRITNRGTKTITGLELTANALGLDSRTIVAQNTSRPIPLMRSAPLKPGESIRVTMNVDTPSNITEGDVSNVVPEVSGLIFQ